MIICGPIENTFVVWDSVVMMGLRDFKSCETLLCSELLCDLIFMRIRMLIVYIACVLEE